MRTLSFVIMALVGTMILGLPLQSYADQQLDILLTIATQARDNLGITISQINNVPDEISQLYKQGSDETDALSKAVDQQDAGSAKQHFLAAMKFFKATNDKINSLNATASNDQQKAQVIQLRGEIIRLDRMGSLLKAIATRNNIGVDFSKFDQLLSNANQDLDAGNISDAITAIKSASDFLIETHNSIATIANERISERAKDFTEKQIERFSNMTGLNPPQIPATPSTAPSTTTPPPTAPQPAAPVLNYTNITTPQNPGEMLAELKMLISEGKVDEALKIIKLLESYQREKLGTAEKEQPPSITTPPPTAPSTTVANTARNLTNNTSTTNPATMVANATGINATSSTTSENGTELNSTAVKSVPMPSLPEEKNSTLANKTGSIHSAILGLGPAHGAYERYHQENKTHNKGQHVHNDRPS